MKNITKIIRRDRVKMIFDIFFLFFFFILFFYILLYGNKQMNHIVLCLTVKTFFLYKICNYYWRPHSLHRRLACSSLLAVCYMMGKKETVIQNNNKMSSIGTIGYNDQWLSQREIWMSNIYRISFRKSSSKF